MSSLALGALAVLAMMQQTDTVFPLDGATRLSVEAPGGSIVVTAWERQEVRIQATHSSRTFVDVDRRGATIDVEAEANRGPATIVDYRISAPAGLDLDLEGMYASITVEGMNGEVEAETMQGDVRVVGGRGTVNVSAVQGSITVENAQGRIEVEGVSGPVRIVGSSGELYVETVGSNIDFENVRAQVVEAGSVGGRIRYLGSLQDGGRYFFGTHGGTVEIGVPTGSNATFSLATLHGSFSSDLPGAPERIQRGQRSTFAVGNGSAQVEVETFGGRIAINGR